MNQTRIKEVFRHELKYLPMWYVLISCIAMFIQMLMNWHVEGQTEHSFDVFGPSVLLTVLFPIIWFVIYAYCRVRVDRNKVNADVEPVKKKEGGIP